MELFAPGCLGTCWYGRYHYMEPWVGCEHDCDYCYARYRSVVSRSLAERATTFDRPVPILEPDLLDKTIRNRLSVGDIEILKLSRFTDVFGTTLLGEGLAYRVLRAVVESPVRRVIITTKGVPDSRTLALIADHKDRFSYNVVAKPASSLTFEKRVPPVAARLAVAQELQHRGVLTTVHMDPLVPGFEDAPAEVDRFLDTLRGLGLSRVMFSLLLLCDPMVEDLRRRAGSATADNILSLCDRSDIQQYLPDQAETASFSFRPEVQRSCVETIARALKAGRFAYVLCSLKNTQALTDIDPALCPPCDGSFYA